MCFALVCQVGHHSPPCDVLVYFLIHSQGVYTIVSFIKCCQLFWSVLLKKYAPLKIIRKTK